MPRTVLAVALLLAALCGCSMSADTAAAEQGVPKFHEQLDASRFDEIWEQSGDEMKKAMPQPEFVEFLAAVHRKLGNTKSADKTGWNVNYQTSGSLITLGYKATRRNSSSSACRTRARCSWATTSIRWR